MASVEHGQIFNEKKGLKINPSGSDSILFQHLSLQFRERWCVL